MKLVALSTTHGHNRNRKKTPELEAWHGMRKRCYNPNAKDWHSYGGRGIRVAAEWRGPAGFQAFLAHIGLRPGPGYTVDRIRVNEDYKPGNVRWATRKEQSRNRRTNTLIEHDGETRILTEWLEQFGVSHELYRSRKKRGWSADRAATTPPRR